MKVTPTLFDKIMSICSMIFLLLGIICFLLEYENIPQKIPMHYNLYGKVDRYGSKNEIIILLVIMSIIWMILESIKRYPNIWNMMSYKVENEELAYKETLHFLSSIIFIVMGFFLYIILQSIYLWSFNIWFVFVFFMILCSVIGYWIYQLRKLR